MPNITAILVGRNFAREAEIACYADLDLPPLRTVRFGVISDFPRLLGEVEAWFGVIGAKRV